jgi:xanthine dehydrogenase YagR molybdenum-binding subunit
MDTSSAESAPGVLAILTHLNTPPLKAGPVSVLGPPPQPPLQGDQFLHHGQYIALVVAETPTQAADAARLVRVEYDLADAVLDIDDSRGDLQPMGGSHATGTRRGDTADALGRAEIAHEAVYTTATNTNNPMGLFATVAAWEDGRVTIHDSTQWTKNVQATIAEEFEVQPSAVRVHAPVVGGAFGAGLQVWPHVSLTVLAARIVRRPVKLVLTRPQMVTGIGHRPNTRQTLKLGTRRGGDLIAIEHSGINTLGIKGENYEPLARTSADSYACANVLTRDLQRRLNIAPAGWMRGPGDAEGNFALESAIDELAYKLRMDPIALRLRNYATTQLRNYANGRSRSQAASTETVCAVGRIRGKLCRGSG